MPPATSRARPAMEICPLSSIFFLAPRTDDDRSPSIEPLSKRHAVLQFVQNTYMNWLLDREGRANEFDAIVKLVSRIPPVLTGWPHSLSPMS